MCGADLVLVSVPEQPAVGSVLLLQPEPAEEDKVSVSATRIQMNL